MRKILYSPGYGAGWTSWNDEKIKAFLLTYEPIISFLESGKSFSHRDIEEKTLHPLLVQMRLECLEKFQVSHVCVLGADDLQVATVDGPVRIEEYDGFESYKTRDTDTEWL